MKQFSLTVKFIDPCGNGLISTFMVKAVDRDAAHLKGEKMFWTHAEKLWGNSAKNDIEIIWAQVETLKQGFFTTRSFKNLK